MPDPRPDKTDSDLLAAWLAGDRSAMAMLFVRHVDSSYRLARSYSRDDADAEDAVQTAFVKVCEKAAQFRTKGSAKAWILRIVHTTCCNRHNEEARRRHRQQQAAEEVPMSTRHNAEDAVAAVEHSSLIREAVDKLPEHYRLPLTLTYFEDMPVAEVAEVLQRPRRTVDSQIRRGLDALRGVLTRRGLTMGTTALATALTSLPAITAPVTLLTTSQHIAHTATLPTTAAMITANTTSVGIAIKGILSMTALATAALLIMSTAPSVIGEGTAAPDAIAEPVAAIGEVEHDHDESPEDLPSESISLHLIRHTLPEALTKLNHHLDGHLLWALPFRHSETRSMRSRYISNDIGPQPIRLDALLDHFADSYGLRWQWCQGTLVFTTQPPADVDAERASMHDQAATLEQRLHSAVTLAESGDVEAMTWIMDQALETKDDNHPARHYIRGCVPAYGITRQGRASILILAHEDEALRQRIAQKWTPLDYCLTGLAQALRIPEVKDQLLAHTLTVAKGNGNRARGASISTAMAQHLVAIADAHVVESLCDALPTTAPQHQAQLISILGMIGDRKALPALENCFTGDDAHTGKRDDRYHRAMVRNAAAAALAHIDAQRYLPGIIATLSEPDTYVRSGLVESLIIADIPAAVDVIADELSTPSALDPDQSYARILIAGLYRMSHPQAHTTLESLLSNKHEHLRLLAAQMLANRHHPQAAALLKAQVEQAVADGDKHKEDARRVTQDHANLMSYASCRHESVGTHLLALATSDEIGKQRIALRALPLTRDPRLAQTLREFVLTPSTDEIIRRRALGLLGEHGASADKAILLDVIQQDDSSPTLRSTAIRSLATHYDDDEVRTVVFELAKGSDSSAITALNALGPLIASASEPTRTTGLSILVEQARHGEPVIRQSAHTQARWLQRSHGIQVADMPEPTLETKPTGDIGTKAIDGTPANPHPAPVSADDF